jgi:hypothetical protein
MKGIYVATILVAVLLGGVLAGAWQVLMFYAARRKRFSQVLRQTEALPSSRGVLPESQKPEGLSRNDILHIITQNEKTRSLLAWLQNLVWFVLGSGVSLFTSELRNFLGL